MFRRWLTALALVLLAGQVAADPPVASYIFPAGGRRGTTVPVRVGGLNLHQGCFWEMLGQGVQASKQLRGTRTIWFEGPVLPLPESQQQEDYPRDVAGQVTIAGDAGLGPRAWRLRTSQGATLARWFVVGDLPEIVEQEIEGDPVPVTVQLPVTINGRIFPRENVDIWAFGARKGQEVSCEVMAARIGSPLDSRLEVRDPQGRILAENDDHFGADSFLRFTAPTDGTYQVRIHDINFRGGPAYVYRLTLTADPYIDHIYPLGGRRGSTVRFELAGQGLPKEPVAIPLPAHASSPYAHRLTVGGKLINPVLLELDDLPEYLEAEPNDTPEKANPVNVPAVLNGRIDRPGDVDFWAVTARKGEPLDLDLRAGRLGSPLRAVLTITDAAGKQLAHSDGNGGREDPVLRFKPPADGAYRIRVGELFHSRGGPRFAYRLRIAPAAPPDFRLRLLSDALTLNRGGQAVLKLQLERRNGFRSPITLQVEGLPPGVTVQGTTIAANQAAANLVFKADATAGIQGARLTIRGSADVGGKPLSRTAVLLPGWAMPDIDSVLLGVALPTPFQIKGDYDMGWAARGAVHQRRYRIERNGFTGPIRVRVADHQARHLQGVTGPVITVPAGVSEFTYTVYLPPWMETGRTSRTCVMAVSVVKDRDGTEHTVSFTSVQPKEQVIVVVEPGRLGLEMGQSTLLAEAGKTVALAVRIMRGKSLQGPAKIELLPPAHLRSITAVPLVIPADGSGGTLGIRFPSPVPRLINAPILIRATILEKGKPVVAETRLEVQGPR